MTDSKDKVIQSAKDSGLFRTVSRTMFFRDRPYPALAVESVTDRTESVSAGHSKYRGNVEVQTWIFIRKEGNTESDLDQLVKGYLKKLQADNQSRFKKGVGMRYRRGQIDAYELWTAEIPIVHMTEWSVK